MIDSVPPITHAPREPRMRKPPFWLIAVFLVAVIATWIPLVIAARAKFSKSNEPRVLIFQDMHDQPKYRPQRASAIFADGRAMRPKIDGTVARGQLQDDDHYYRGFSRTQGADGKSEVKFFDGLPQQVQLTPELLRRGEERFNIYCASCHGIDGSGNGMINERAVELQERLWVAPSDLHSDVVRKRPDGHIYNTINVGIRNMPAHGPQIAVADRWSIVAYLRALQLSQNAPAKVVPQEKLDTLR